MFNAFVLVRNVESQASGLDFGEFTINRVGPRFSELRDTFSSVDVNPGDWILEKAYAQLPAGPPGSPVGSIPNDIEDILLLLRLYKSGDISFVKQAIVPPNGRPLVQFPYRAMNDLNSYSTLRFEMETEECELWRGFAAGIRRSQSWNAEWFTTARRFFLSGGATQFNPRWDDVDRVLDYSTALEATLVPERDFNTRRMSRRAAALITGSSEEKNVVGFIRRLYDIRSRIVHGSGLDTESREWLFENCGSIELRVRQVLTAAVQQLPAGEEERRVFLAGLYDPTDEDRGDYVVAKFGEVKALKVRKAVAAKIARSGGG